MKYNIRKLSRQTARIAFQVEANRHSTGSLKVWQIRKNNADAITRAHGVILGENPRKPRSAVIKVSRGDLVIVSLQKPCGEMESLHEFRISESFEPVSHGYSETTDQKKSPPIHLIPLDEDSSSSLDESDLKTLFRNRHPTWLQSILSEQLECWRDHSAPLFLRFTPDHSLSKHIDLLVAHDPARALRNYRDCMDAAHFAECVRQQPSVAMREAFEQIPYSTRRIHLEHHAAFLLENHLEQLTDSELRICAKKDPKAAFKCRLQLSPRRHAIVLARSYGVVWHTLFGDERQLFREEAIRSLARYPIEWLAADSQGFEGIFRKFSHKLGISLSSGEMHELLGRMPSRAQQPLASYIALFI